MIEAMSGLKSVFYLWEEERKKKRKWLCPKAILWAEWWSVSPSLASASSLLPSLPGTCYLEEAALWVGLRGAWTLDMRGQGTSPPSGGGELPPCRWQAWGLR